MKPAVTLIAALFLLFADIAAFGQEERYSMSYRHVQLDDALQELSELAEVAFIYQSGLTRNIRVNGVARDKTVREILDDLLDGTPLRYRKSDTGTYMIFRPVTGIRRHGSISGSVFDAETGRPLGGANIFIEATGRGVSSGSDGTFELGRLLPGTQELRVSYVGYRPESHSVEVLPGMDNMYNFRLNPVPLSEPRVIITDGMSPLQYMRAGTDIADFEVFFIQNPAGTPDAMRPLGDVPGVRFNVPLADLSLQGSPSTQHRVELDGTKVFSPLSMGRLLSAFSPFAVRRLTLHRAGFEASAGSSLSGIVAVEQAASMPGADPFLVQTDMNSFNLRGLQEWEPAEGYRLYTMGAFRHNTPWINLNPSLTYTVRELNYPDPLLYSRLVPSPDPPVTIPVVSRSFDMGFYDFHFSSMLRQPGYASTALNLYAGSSSINPKITSGNLGGPPFASVKIEDDYRWVNRLANISHNVLLTENTSITADLSVSHHVFRHRFRSVESEPIGDNKRVFYDMDIYHSAAMVSGGLSYVYEWDAATRLETGLRSGYSRIVLDADDWPGGPWQTEPVQRKFSGFTQFEHQWENNTRFTGGMRYTFLPGTGFFPEPRVSYGVDFPDTEYGNWSVLLSGGLYREFVQQLSVSSTSPSGIYPELMIWMPVTETGRVPMAWHTSADVRWEPESGLLFRVEPYLKWQPIENIVNYAAAGNGSGAPERFANAKIRTAGIGLSAQLERSRHLLSLLYHYSHVRMQTSERFGGAFIQPDWAEPHQIVLTGQAGITPNLTVNSRLELLPGRRTWAYRQAYYNVLAEESEMIAERFSNPEKDRLDLYTRFDLGFGWNRQGSFANWTVTLEIRNLFFHRNEFDRGLLNPSGLFDDTSDARYRRAPARFQPGISVQATF